MSNSIIYNKILCLFNNKIVKDIIDSIIIIIFSIYTTMSFLLSSMFNVDWLAYPYIRDWISDLLLIMIIIKFSLYSNSNIAKIIIFMLIMIIAQRYCFVYYGRDLMLLSIAFSDIDFEKIIKAHLISLCIFMIICIISSNFDIIINLIYTMIGRRPRNSFGISYATNFAAYMTYGVIDWVYLRRKSIKILDYFVIIGMIVFVIYYCDARLAAVCMCCLLFLLLLYNVLNHKKTKGILNILFKIATYAFPVAAFTIVMMSILYNRDFEFWTKLDYILTNRLNLGHRAFVEYDLKLFGQYIETNGMGETTLKTISGMIDYFCLDSVFVNAIMKNGIIFFFMLILFFWNISDEAYKHKDYVLICIMVVLALNAMIEHHLTEMNYDPFILMMFTNNWGIKATEK